MFMISPPAAALRQEGNKAASQQSEPFRLNKPTAAAFQGNGFFSSIHRLASIWRLRNGDSTEQQNLNGFCFFVLKMGRKRKLQSITRGSYKSQKAKKLRVFFMIISAELSG